MTKNKNLFKNISLFLCLVPMLLLSLLVAFPKKELKSVSAASDSVSAYYDYLGASTISLTSIVSLGQNLREALPIDVRFDLYTSSLGTRIGGDFCYYTATDSPPFIEKHNLYLFGASGNEITLNNLFAFNYSEQLFLSKSSYELNTYGGFPVGVVNYGDFTGNIRHIELGSSLDYKVFTYGSGHIKAFYIKFVETDNDYFYIEFLMPRIIEYEPRIYFIQDPSNFGDNDHYNFGYDAGYNAGYTDGNSDGNSSGYTDGYSAGQSFGYQNGYNAGLEASGKYSFNSLIGAVIDAPVSAFTSLLNFEILGFNILGFITGLLTLALIVFIIKLCLGGK